MEKLLPDRLKELWGDVDRKKITGDRFWEQQQQWTAEYKAVWTEALLLEGYRDLNASLFAEMGRYVGCSDVAEIERRCRQAHKAVATEWATRVDPADRASVEAFYEQSQTKIYGLLWWHTLEEDIAPLAYVMALAFARNHGCRACLDYGAGIGTSGVLFARHGLEVALADIATPLLRFCQWRMDLRKLPVRCVDLKTETLPRASFDFVSAMDVFEHLCDPVGAVEQVCAALKPGGFLFGRFAAEAPGGQVEHVVHDLKPTFERMAALGLVEVWRDEWLWGHQAFQKKG